MSATATVRRNKYTIQETLCGDPTLILTKVHERKLITDREYNNLKNSNKGNVEMQIVDLVDKIMNKGEDTCQVFLDLLQTDGDITSTFPKLQKIQLKDHLTPPVQVSGSDLDYLPDQKRQKKDGWYELKSNPVGLCLIINNENFSEGNRRSGTNKDAQDLSEVFSWLGFRVLMCKDRSKQQMEQALQCFASLSSSSQLQNLNLKEWSDSGFTDLQQPPPEHGDAFICCILSHGERGVVFGTDGRPLSIKEVTATFKATDHSPLTGKPKVFLIQACQGGGLQHGVLVEDLEADDFYSIPVEADFLVASATVEGYQALRHRIHGSWFVQSVCQQLKEGCPRGDDIFAILCRVNNEVSLKEGSKSEPGAVKQMPEISRTTLRAKLVLQPHNM